MINWLIILVLISVAFFIIKVEHFNKRAKVILIVVIISLIYFSATALLRSNDIQLNSVQGVGNAIGLYFGWIGNAAVAVWDAGGEALTIVGNAIRMNNTEKDFKGTVRNN